MRCAYEVCVVRCVLFCNQKVAYEMRMSDWSSDVCSSDLAWLNKWFWRGMRMLALVGTMMDYMLSKRVMSWKEAWELYGVENGGALFRDLARYGIRPPKGWEDRKSVV